MRERYPTKDALVVAGLDARTDHRSAEYSQIVSGFDPPRPDESGSFPRPVEPPPPMYLPPPPTAAPPAHGVIPPAPTQPAAPPAVSVSPTAPFDQRTGRESAGRRGLILGVLAVAAVIGGGLGFMLSRGGSDEAAGDAAVSTVADDSSGSETTAVETTVEETVAPTSSTVVETTAPAATNPFGVVVGTTADPASPLVEERYVANLGVNLDNALPNSPAFAAAAWWLVVNQRVMPLAWVATENGYEYTDTFGGRTEFRDPVVTDGLVSDITFCPRRNDGSLGTCLTTSERITVTASDTVVATGPTTAFTPLATVVLNDTDVSVMFNYTTAQPIVGASSLTGGLVSWDSLVLVYTGPNTLVTVDVLLTFADGSQETVTMPLQ
jgi:hypothetical protein